ncbi:flagellar biosynthesis anti-sigma factor FlgM [Aquabacterium sp. A7-Y]|uniref:flagellar biosynthesis anti-sigma factor FlgM n=1 Tax=Aquabacterium sp. A7-Y TaxID=1349605 RepID=UPI00223CFFB9|nr:flagellar biosynthesis anti-sigma factor FlgM [Aquabacterium sp. A7-Y]MCW7540517.1 flagellar biosynthesis anti-sigma factor FlgM [Aquabacterium sp. A7-Y]
MKIGNHTETPSVALSTGTGPRATGVDAAATAAAAVKASAAQPAEASESATVKLSSTATSLMSSSAEFDAEKVAAMKAAIANGTFRVNPEAIADKLIANAREVLDRTSH